MQQYIKGLRSAIEKDFSSFFFFSRSTFTLITIESEETILSCFQQSKAKREERERDTVKRKNVLKKLLTFSCRWVHYKEEEEEFFSLDRKRFPDHLQHQ